MKRLLLTSLVICLSFNASAESGSEETSKSDSWGLGLAAALSDSPYAGEGTKVMPYPLISYEGEHFYFRGITAGWEFIESGGFALSAIAEPKLDGFDVKDLGRSDLAKNGVDYRLLEDRKNGINAGLRGVWRGNVGQLEAKILSDVSDRSGGLEASFQYGYPIQLWRGILTPTVGAKWLSKDTANYYFGTLDSEVARGVVDYKPGAATIPRVGLSYYRPIGEKWSIIGSVDYNALPSRLKNSPLVDPSKDATTTFFIGFSRGFTPWWMSKK